MNEKVTEHMFKVNSQGVLQLLFGVRPLIVFHMVGTL